MPTISEPIARSHVPASWPPSRANLQDHAAALMADMRDAGLTPSPLNVLRQALEVGIPETIAVALAGMVDEDV